MSNFGTLVLVILGIAASIMVFEMKQMGMQEASVKQQMSEMKQVPKYMAHYSGMDAETH